MNYAIPFNKAYLSGRELEYMSEAIGLSHISGDGAFTRRCHAWLEAYLNVAKTLLTTSCTHALEMAAYLIDITPGDEVIFPSFTFVSTVNAFVVRGARPIFVDIRPDTLNIDERLIEAKITAKTKAIVVVHYAGVGCEMDAITAIADEYNLIVIEDNAHGLFGKYRGKLLGTFGVLAAQSFHETKNISCGEGGALVINDPRLIERAEIIREKGTDRSRFFRGQVDKYTWVDLGSSYLPSDILAAFLLAQLESSKVIQHKRKRVWETYHQELPRWAEPNAVHLPFIPEYCQQPYHMYYLILPSLELRQALIGHLKSRKILSVFHYLPLHSSTMGRKFGGHPGDCPVTEDISARLLRLPFYTGIESSEQNKVIDAIRIFTC